MILIKSKFLAAACGAILLGTSPAKADLTVVGETTFGTIQQAIDALGEEFYTSLNPRYTPTSFARFNFVTENRALSIRYRRDDTSITLVDKDSKETLATFEAATREAAEVELMEYLSNLFRGSTEELRLTVANTPTDPVAGSPLSLQSRMAGATFSNGTTIGPSALTGGNRARGTLSRAHLGVGFETGRYTGPNFSANISSLPISYVAPLNDPRWALKIDAPLTFTEINGVETVSGSVGIGLRMPVFENWTLTPEIRVGAVRNRDAGVTGKLAALSVVSNYHIPMQGGYGLTIGNALTYSKAFGSAYDFDNVINKNGVELTGPFDQKLYGLPTNWQLSLVHTKIGGDPTYISEWMDLSLSLGTIGSKNGVTWDSVRVGLTYTHATRGVRGLNFNFGYEF